MATIRKHYKKWQAIVRKKNIVVGKSFHLKSEAQQWSYRVEAQIELGTYLDTRRAEKLNEIT